ncbi:NADP-dependent 3-hydroxy acid dehydrogenase YdfG [Actinacidiphila alni]|uniref:Probable oxidoreductase n=1 Tax=Actinacidiphila alni TaxID=380248 RepID=A0A1I2JJ80_9ACTN|nr:SDR family NAD(P)-dependent oxidoreductase [Actinacidiphila alni]SFF53913.1 NADP-dependent 3-hydroxy acid dehydrogenase YdfG [Actinacidiphila alni]
MYTPSTPQQPLGSGFGAASTTAEVIAGIDLTGRTAVVTGGYSGLGRETVRTFLAAGARVIVPARDTARAEKALDGIGDADRLQVWPMDLLDPASIDAFADRFLATGDPLHLLVNSAGIMAAPLTRDARGFESQFATNHLGHFQLTARLWPALVAAHGARVVQVSSLGHRYSPVDLDDPHFERGAYDPWVGYGRSKTANILFALALDARGRDSGVRAFSLHPGSIAGTGLEKHVDPRMLKGAGMLTEDGTPVLDPARGLKTPEQGAATIVWAATGPALDGHGGVYCENCDIAPYGPDLTGRTSMAQSRRLYGVQRYAVDPDTADRLWTLSERLLGLTFATAATA